MNIVTKYVNNTDTHTVDSSEVTICGATRGLSLLGGEYEQLLPATSNFIHPLQPFNSDTGKR